MVKSTEEDFKEQSTYDLALGLALNKFNETDKFEVLKVIEERQADSGNSSNKKLDSKLVVSRPGTKSEMIRKLHEQGKTPKQIFDTLNKKGTKLNGKQVKVYFPEIYRITGKKK